MGGVSILGVAVFLRVGGRAKRAAADFRLMPVEQELPYIYRAHEAQDAQGQGGRAGKEHDSARPGLAENGYEEVPFMAGKKKGGVLGAAIKDKQAYYRRPGLERFLQQKIHPAIIEIKGDADDYLTCY